MPEPLSNATFLRRAGALVYDSLLLFALLIAAATPVVLMLGGEDGSGVKGIGFQLYLYAVVFFFYGWFWTNGGQTLGMRAWKIQALRYDNRPMGWDAAIVRYLSATISVLAFGIGLLWILIDKDNHAWHDVISKSKIIYNPDLGKKA